MTRRLASVEGISKHFSGSRAVDKVRFDVAAGAIQALIGPNGAGKTTIFNMIAGVFRPDTGDIAARWPPLIGKRPDQICRAGVGRTFQLVRAVHRADGRGECRDRRADLDRRHKEAREHAGGVLKLLGLDDKRYRRPAASRCPTANAWKSRARSRPSRRCFCSTR